MFNGGALFAQLRFRRGHSIPAELVDIEVLDDRVATVLTADGE